MSKLDIIAEVMITLPGTAVPLGDRQVGVNQKSIADISHYQYPCIVDPQ